MLTEVQKNQQLKQDISYLLGYIMPITELLIRKYGLPETSLASVLEWVISRDIEENTLIQVYNFNANVQPFISIYYELSSFIRDSTVVPLCRHFIVPRVFGSSSVIVKLELITKTLTITTNINSDQFPTRIGVCAM